VLVKERLRFVVNAGLEHNRNKRSVLQDVFVLGGFVLSPSGMCDLDIGFKYSVAPPKIESPGPDFTVLAGLTFRYEAGGKDNGQKK